MKSYFNNSNFKSETLKWETFVPVNARKLIIGTFPPVEKLREFEFFYPNTKNPFWEILAEIAEMELTTKVGLDAVEIRKQILDKLNLAITDIGYKIYRLNDSSSDQKIFPIEFMDIFKELDNNQNIKELIFTSSSNGNNVEDWFRIYYNNNYSINLPKLKGKNPKDGTFIHNGLSYKYTIVHSTSGATRRSKNDLIEMYKEVICSSN